MIPTACRDVRLFKQPVNQKRDSKRKPNRKIRNTQVQSMCPLPDSLTQPTDFFSPPPKKKVGRFIKTGIDKFKHLCCPHAIQMQHFQRRVRRQKTKIHNDGLPPTTKRLSPALHRGSSPTLQNRRHKPLQKRRSVYPAEKSALSTKRFRPAAPRRTKQPQSLPFRRHFENRVIIQRRHGNRVQ